MPYFKDEQEVYDYIGKLFQDLVKDEEMWPKFRRANTIVQYQFRNPESQITVRMRENEDAQVDLGPSDLEPEVLMRLDATDRSVLLGLLRKYAVLARPEPVVVLEHAR